MIFGGGGSKNLSAGLLEQFLFLKAKSNEYLDVKIK